MARLGARSLVPMRLSLARALLRAVDRRANVMRITRDQLVARALRRELQEGPGWSPGFFERLSKRDPDTSDAVDDMVHAIRKARRSKSATR